MDAIICSFSQMRKLRLREAKLLTQGHTANKVDPLHSLALSHEPLGIKKPSPVQPRSRATVKLRRDRGWVSLYGIRPVISITAGGSRELTLREETAQRFEKVSAPAPGTGRDVQGLRHCQGSPHRILSLLKSLPSPQPPGHTHPRATSSPQQHTPALRLATWPLPMPRTLFHSPPWQVSICPF